MAKLHFVPIHELGAISDSKGEGGRRWRGSFSAMLLLKAVCILCIVHSSPAGANFAVPMQPEGKVVMGYYTSWAIKQFGYTPFDIPVEELTHINYAFAKISNGSIDYFDEEADTKLPISNPYPDLGPETFVGCIDAMNNPRSPFRLRNPNIQTLISIGGWTESKYFSDVALTPESRLKFAESVVEFVQHHKFDGVDIDWEYPIGGGAADNIVRPDDVPNFTKLMATLRTELTRAFYESDSRLSPYLLTIATGVAKGKYLPLEVPQLLQSVDWFCLMTYDYNGPGYSTAVGHNAPLNLVESSVQGYYSIGLPPNRMVLGIPFYGHSYGGVNNATVGSAFDRTMTPNGTIDKGTVAFKDVAANYTFANGYEPFWDDVAKVPYLFNSEKRIWISTENPTSVFFKTKLAMNNEMRGVFTWALPKDDNMLLSVMSDMVLGQPIYHQY